MTHCSKDMTKKSISRQKFELSPGRIDADRLKVILAKFCKFSFFWYFNLTNCLSISSIRVFGRFDLLTPTFIVHYKVPKTGIFYQDPFQPHLCGQTPQPGFYSNNLAIIIIINISNNSKITLYNNINFYSSHV